MPWFRVSQWWIFQLESLRAVLLHSVTVQESHQQAFMHPFSEEKRGPYIRSSGDYSTVWFYKKKKKKSDAFLMNTRKSTICVQEHVSSSPPPLANSAANGQLHLCTHACTVYGVWISSIIIKVKKAIAMQSTLKCMILSSSGMCVKFRHCFWCFPLFRCFII